MISRNIIIDLKYQLFKGKVLLVMGPRQTGKTTMIRNLLAEVGKPYLFLDGDDPGVRQTLENINTIELKRLIGAHDIVYIDEVQRIPNSGLTLKIISDQIQSVQVICTGSSALELGDKLNEPLTGRKRTYYLYPISWQEFSGHTGYLDARQDLENRLLYGMYPEVISRPDQPVEVLRELVSGYLYRDVLALSGIRKPALLEKLLQALALQVGSEVSYNELSNLLGIDKNTVSNYIDLLEKAFVLFTLQPFSRNIRNEISSTRKIYFYDNGVRNMILGNFNNFELRPDKGALWENFLISERFKRHQVERSLVKMYFWRTHARQEIDLVEEDQAVINAYEIKWKSKKIKTPKTFEDAYDAKVQMIHRDNVADFLLPLP